MEPPLVVKESCGELSCIRYRASALSTRVGPKMSKNRMMFFSDANHPRGRPTTMR